VARAWTKLKKQSSEWPLANDSLRLTWSNPRVLLDLNTTEDPVWTYFDSQHKIIMAQMDISYKKAVATIRCASHIVKLSRFILNIHDKRRETPPIPKFRIRPTYCYPINCSHVSLLWTISNRHQRRLLVSFHHTTLFF
jgi:hypothetical protein